MYIQNPDGSKPLGRPLDLSEHVTVRDFGNLSTTDTIYEGWEMYSKSTGGTFLVIFDNVVRNVPIFRHLFYTSATLTA